MADPKQQVTLTSQELDTAQALARVLAPHIDRNELGKAFDFFRRTGSKAAFFKLLAKLPHSGYVRSKRTRGYLQNIADGCQKYLKNVPDERALAIVGWSFRLITYYQTQKGQRYARNR